MTVTTKSDLFRRAHGLCALNSSMVRDKGYRATFRWALAFAWRELKSGDVKWWTPRPRLETLKAELIDLQGRPLAQRVGPQIDAARREIAALEYAA